MQKTIRTNRASQWFIIKNNNNQGNMMEPSMPFEPGDYISILMSHITLTGKVLTKGLKSIKLKSTWGNIIIIPNSLISSATVINLSAEEKHLLCLPNDSIEKEKVASL